LASLTVENYIKTIYQICSTQPDEPAGTGQLAEALGVSPGTVTSMLKTLSEGGLATYKPYEGVRLTPSGTSLALRVLRRHRLVELFLAKTLELSWDEVHDEAENLEHAVSDLLVDRMDAYLDYPKVDPHGDPIPRADGTLKVPGGRSLSACQEEYEFRFTRVLDQSPEFLRFLTEEGLSLGVEGRVVSRSEAAGTITINLDGRPITLGLEAAQKMLVSARRGATATA
jgi:DtxR family Mn-dependent transcriptional regulator